jgi:hypothetical protein
MLLKRLSTIVAVFFFLTAFSSFAYADSAGDAANAAITTGEQAGMPTSITVNGQTENLTYVQPPPELQIPGFGSGTSYGYLVYGSPFDPNSSGEDRYEGYSEYGDEIDNVAFPPDSDPDGANFEDENWVETPWYNQQVRTEFGITDTALSGAAQYEGSILEGIELLNTTTGIGGTGGGTGYTITDTDGNALWSSLSQYADVLEPPTKVTWGIARMWHTDASGNLWYVTIPLPPLCDALIVDPSSASVSVGGTEQYTAIFYDNGQPTTVTTQSSWL